MNRMMKNNKRIYFGVFFFFILAFVVSVIIKKPERITIPILETKEMLRVSLPIWEKPGKYWVTYRETPNTYEGENEVTGIVLHHTAYEGPADQVVQDLCDPSNPVSCHVVIDKDGTRYVLAPPEAITWHAGFSKWGDRYKVNLFMIGIEFQGNTLIEPLTDEQIESSLEYMKPIIDKYGIKPDNIVTHQMIRDAYRDANPKNKKAWPKFDITPEEYSRVINALDTALHIVREPENKQETVAE